MNARSANECAADAFAAQAIALQGHAQDENRSRVCRNPIEPGRPLLAYNFLEIKLPSAP